MSFTRRKTNGRSRDRKMIRSYYDFFCGGGMAGYGLGGSWRCVFANDFDEMKAETYRANQRDVPEILCKDIKQVDVEELPGLADLAWASFPCQDLSLAGNGVGLNGERSGTFWAFWRLMQELDNKGRAPRSIVLENVYGAITSHGGKDFLAIADAFAKRSYRFGAVVIDAERFVPQSRERLFIIAVHESVGIPARLAASGPNDVFHPPSLLKVRAMMKKETAAQWVWWQLPTPTARIAVLSDILEGDDAVDSWHTAEQTDWLLRLMDANNRSKVQRAIEAKVRSVGTVYRRTRPTKAGGKTQRAEVRFDEVAGCLRTPAGGSSRQTILVVDRGKVRSRLLTAREAARLMGLPDRYKLPPRYNDAYHVAGDGVVVPVVRFLAKHVLEPVFGKSNET